MISPTLTAPNLEKSAQLHSMKVASLCRQAWCHSTWLKGSNLYRPHDRVRWKSSGAGLGAAATDMPVDHALQSTIHENKKKRRIRYISTLDPARLTVNDVVDLSHQRVPCFRPYDLSDKHYVDNSFKLDRGGAFGFPPGTRGFLYYHADSGGLRFRVTPDSNPTSFEAGVDLKRRSSTRPWSFDLKKIITIPKFASLRRFLLRDGLLSPSEDVVAMSSSSLSNSRYSKSLHVLLSAFDPQRLHAHDYIDVSGRSQVFFRLRPHNEGMCFVYSHNGAKSLPPGTHGFIYYHTPLAPVPPTGGELRFRITQNSDPASFTAGSDAKSTRGLLPWSLPLWAIAKDERFSLVRDQLLREELITQDTLDKVERASEGLSSLTQYFVLHHLNQEFLLDLQGTVRNVWTMGAEGSGRFFIPSIWADTMRGVRRSATYPLTGMVRVRFERSPFPKHAKKRKVVLRILKIVEPVRCITFDNNSGNVVAPVEGDFVCRMNARSRRAHPLAFDIDYPSYHALRLLWDLS